MLDDPSPKIGEGCSEGQAAVVKNQPTATQYVGFESFFTTGDLAPAHKSTLAGPAIRLVIIGRRADSTPKRQPRTPDLPHYGSGVRLGMRTCAGEWSRNILHLLNVWRHITCTFYEFLRIQWADIMGGFGRKCALKRHFVRPIITGLDATPPIDQNLQGILLLLCTYLNLSFKTCTYDFRRFF